jgi:hypothetical protein
MEMLSNAYGIIPIDITMKQWEKAWLAAAIDREGSITHSYCGDSYCRLRHYRLSISNVNYAILRRTSRLIGFGKISKRNLKANKLPLHMYVLTDSRVLHDVLNEVLPFLIVKRNRSRKVSKYLESGGLTNR